MPGWVVTGFDEYRKRLGPECTFQLIEIAAEKRGSATNTQRVLEKEGQRLLAAVPRGAIVIALERQGKEWSTRDLATRLQNWMQSGQDVVLLVGGPEGLAPEVLQQAKEKWSLSALTFPHALVRIIVAEQLYRAFSILKNHPYHK